MKSAILIAEKFFGILDVHLQNPLHALKARREYLPQEYAAKVKKSEEKYIEFDERI